MANSSVFTDTVEDVDDSTSSSKTKVKEDGKAALNPERCHFFLKKKTRYCRTIPPNGAKYCVEHSHLLGEACRKRITCPLDPKHTCYEDQLKKHLKKCNARDGVHEEYFVKNVNLGDDEANSSSQTDLQVTVRTVETSEILQMIEKVKKLYQEHIGSLEREILFHESLREETEKSSNGPAAQKHLQQQASLVGHIDKEGFLSNSVAFVEFGAGKGGLSHWVQRAAADCDDLQFVLVEKGGIRYKMDNYHKSKGPVFERLRIDIQHLHLGRVQSLTDQKRPIVGIGKHLCGGATDLMLRCLIKTTSVTKELSPENVAKTRKVDSCGEVKGVVLATCCHHRCDWQSYVGKQFMQTCGLSGRDFSLLCSMTSWATCATPLYLQRLQGGTDAQEGTEQRQQPDSGNAENTIQPETNTDKLESVDSAKQPDAGTDKENSSQNTQQPVTEVDKQNVVPEESTQLAETGTDKPNGISSMDAQQTEESATATEKKDTENKESSDNKEQKDSEQQSDEIADHDVVIDTQDYNHPRYGNLSPEERETIGYMCKRLIDTGRVKYLAQHRYSARLVHYIDKKYSLEDVALIAKI